MFFITEYILFIFVITSLSPTICESVAIQHDFTTNATKQIVRLAKSAEIKAMLNTQADPCEDFYQYACGRWHRHNPAQLMTNIITDRFHSLANAYERRLVNFLDWSQNKTNDALENKVRDFYISCQMIDVDHISYILHLENIYKEYTDMPALSNGNWTAEAEFVWWQVLANIQQKYGSQIIFAVDVMPNLKNKTHQNIYLSPAMHTMRSNARVAEQLQETRVCAELERLFGLERRLAEKTAQEICTFEQALMQSVTNAELGMELEDLLTITKLDDAMNGFNLKKFLELSLGDLELLPAEIYIYDIKYFNNTLKLIAETPKSIVANYILWQLLQQYLVDLAGMSEEKVCQEITKKFFGKYLDYALYQNYKTADMEQDVFNVWEEVRATFRDDLKGDRLDWISNRTRESAIEKLNHMTLRINTYENVNFTQIYDNLTINRLGYVENVRKLLMLETQKKLQKFSDLSSTDTESLQNIASAYSASYDLYDNSISVPVTLLQPHFFWDKQYPQAIKYATLGYMIAHEMMHAFVDQGRYHDKEGNKQSWWDDKSTYEFEARRKCFQAQYQNFKFEGQRLPHSVSQSENIADNAAVRLAYKTYRRWLAKQSLEVPNIERMETLPGLTFDNRQLFFVNFAQLWCSDVQILFKYSLAAADTLTPSIYRVIGSLQNFQEFSWVFKCNPEARMDPKYKCYLY